MNMKWLLGIVLLAEPSNGFAGVQHTQQWTQLQQSISPAAAEENTNEASATRRSLLLGSLVVAAAATLPSSVNAAVGSLPELQDTNVILQGITVKVSDPLQQKQMFTFLEDAFDMVVLRGTPDGSDTVSAMQLYYLMQFEQKEQNLISY